MILSLSTMWGVGRFESLADFARKAHELGFSQIELNHQFPAEWLAQLGGLADQTGVAVSSLHDPCPARQLPDGKWASDISLASLDEGERKMAVSLAQDTIALAARVGAGAVVLHMGDVGDYYQFERMLRSWYEDGLAGSRQFQDAQAWEEGERTAHHEAHLEAALKSLRELAYNAADLGIKLGLENRVYFYEIPSIDEMGVLLDEFDPGVVGFWLDVGHAEILHRLGFTHRDEWLRHYGNRLMGTHIHDVNGLTDHRVPGKGDLPWEAFSGGFPSGEILTLELNNGGREEDIPQALHLLRQHGLVD